MASELVAPGLQSKSSVLAVGCAALVVGILSLVDPLGPAAPVDGPVDGAGRPGRRRHRFRLRRPQRVQLLGLLRPGLRPDRAHPAQMGLAPDGAPSCWSPSRCPSSSSGDGPGRSDSGPPCTSSRCAWSSGEAIAWGMSRLAEASDEIAERRGERPPAVRRGPDRDRQARRRRPVHRGEPGLRRDPRLRPGRSRRDVHADIHPSRGPRTRTGSKIDGAARRRVRPLQLREALHPRRRAHRVGVGQRLGGAGRSTASPSS